MIGKEGYENFNKDNIFSYKERLKLNVNEKTKIVEKAMKFIHNNKTYFFDVSTSIEFLSRSLDKKVTIFTHSIDNFNILSEKSGMVVNLIGGKFNKKNRFFYRRNYDEYFSGVEFEAAFIGAGAIKGNGIYYENEEDAYIKGEIVKRAKKVILLAEHQKYEKDAFYKGLNLDQVDIIIVDPISISSFSYIMELHNIKINPKSLVII
ncbi:DeoR/GlpR family DNA-binding transcription regulator [Clostridium beijerinckii]|uniref:DeoR/GlpR family transcriptional regulator of sugar metabolism n=1 Tax=Clostridium beijerinckii TaxID=1520 RepID=A0AAE5LSX1_CLOBE|nr:DeoR/GlpR transcriptional regulator [Clostridium beijerinckii]NSB17287.1 DeoR/GlpR family transcriptional regulator of sugar metabolism [Clostridium beijerinckii]OOM24054.1 HTH-type transcriptional repressor GlcR [Clostridium beijerinckii]